MENKKQHGIFVQNFSKPPVYEEVDNPSPKNHQVQVKMIGSTINPSDRIIIEGKAIMKKPGFVAGMEGFGVVTKAGDQEG
jgi:NADPH:quinone reductase-like Zn-dependent oxidoreductase